MGIINISPTPGVTSQDSFKSVRSPTPPINLEVSFRSVRSPTPLQQDPAPQSSPTPKSQKFINLSDQVCYDLMSMNNFKKLFSNKNC